MEQTIQQQIINKIRILPEEKQKEVLEYAEKLSENETIEEAENDEKPKKRKFVQKIEELMSQLPKDAFEGYPTDGSLNHDHYLYGVPKRDAK